jgi:hypothetical protein
MEVIKEPFDDRSEPDENGMYDYIYAGAYYTFREGRQALLFALYSDTPGVASLKNPIEWRPDVYSSDLFKEALDYLARNESVGTVEVCDPTPPGRGFVPLAEAVELARSAGLSVPSSCS